MAIDINKMKAKMAAAQNNGKGGKSDFWKLTEGEHTVRILPSEDGDPFKEFHFHYNVGKNPGLLCPKKNHGEECPICEFASKLWREGVETDDATLKQEAKKLFVRKRYYSPILVRGKESEGVKVWSYGKMAYENLLGYVLDPDYGDITDAESGTDIVLNYDIPGTPGSFPKTTLKPRRRPSVLCDEAVTNCDELLESVPDIGGLFERKTAEDLQALLDDFLSTDTSSESRSSETTKYKQSGTGVDEAFNKFMNDD